MPFISNEILMSDDVQNMATQASWDIANCLRGTTSRVCCNSILAAYLLYRISCYNNPVSWSYQDVIEGCLDVSEDVVFMAREQLDESTWETLKQLVFKYSPEVFAAAALLPDKNNVDATPDSLVKLAQQLLDIQPTDTVADIGCGVGTFLFASALKEPSATYYGFEINAVNKAITQIRAELIDCNMQIQLQDAFNILESNHDNVRKFNKVFSNYPFGLKLRNLGTGTRFLEKLADDYPGLSKATSSDWVFNALLCELLQDGGKAIGIMTNGSTWNSIDTPMRKYFAEQGMIESVISLPGKMFNSTNIPTSMVLFSYGNNAVRLIDATSICHQGRRFNEFTEDDIAQILNAMNSDSEYSKSIKVSDLRENEYTLNLSRYLKDEISFKNAVPFGSIIKSITRGAPCTADQLDEMVSDHVTNMQYLMLANIQDGVIVDKLPYLARIDPKYEKYCIKNGNLILSKNGYPYKIAVASVRENQQIMANGNLYIIELNEEKVYPLYLKAFFESEPGVAVLKSITVGATIPNIGVEMLRNVSIPLPSMPYQKRIADQYQNTLDEIAIIKLRLERALNRLHHIFDEGVEE